MEMIAAMVYQLTQNLCMDEIKDQGFSDYFVDQTTGLLLLHQQYIAPSEQNLFIRYKHPAIRYMGGVWMKTNHTKDPVFPTAITIEKTTFNIHRSFPSSREITSLLAAHIHRMIRISIPLPNDLAE